MAENNNVVSREIADEKWNRSISKTSRIGGAIALALMIMVPLVTTIVYAENLDVGKTLLSIGSIMLVFAPTAIAENLSLYPIMGIGGMILSVVTGNVSNMKMPAAMSGLKIVDAEVGTPEAEVVSLISVGVSAIVTTIIVFIGMIFGSYLVPILDNPVLKPGFDNVLPALMGALALPVLLTSFKQTLAPLFFAVIMYLVLGSGTFSMLQGFLIIGAMLISVAASYFMHKKGILKGKSK